VLCWCWAFNLWTDGRMVMFVCVSSPRAFPIHQLCFYCFPLLLLG
jgi:hypothetical protein